MGGGGGWKSCSGNLWVNGKKLLHGISFAFFLSLVFRRNIRPTAATQSGRGRENAEVELKLLFRAFA